MCGSKFPISVKLTIDSVDGPERPLEEGLAVAKMLDEMDVDLLHVGRGAYNCRWRMVSSVYQEPGFDIEAVKQIKKIVKNMPVMVHGKLDGSNIAEKALAENAADFVAIGHGLLADPHWPNKTKNNRLDEIIPCIGCGECHYNAMNGKILSCAVTPTTGYEKEYALSPATENKRILVIGGGPAGE